MARGRSKPTVVNNQLHYSLANGVQYIDIFRDLSAINRKLIRQGRIAYITDMTYFIQSGTTGNGGSLFVTALPNDWVHNNAYTKARAHWLAQQRSAQKLIGQSGKPTWEDFKIYYDASHRTGTTLDVPGLSYGEWAYSQFVWEDDAEAIDEVYAHMQGDNVSTTDFGLVKNYQESRATVNSDEPDLPDEYSSNMYAKMAQNLDMVADEVANNMEYANDEPPYDHNDYPGNDSNTVVGNYNLMVCQASQLAKDHSNTVICAPLGLLKLTHTGISASDGSAATAPTASLAFRIAYGNYKGLAAPSFGQ